MHLKHALNVCAFSLATMLAGSAVAQEAATQTDTPATEASLNCFANFNIGPISYCVSEHGNVVRFRAPAAAPEHIAIGVVREGYAVCAANAAGGAPIISHDAANTEAGWQVAVTIAQPNGPNTLPLCITRRTTGNLELTQCFSHIVNTPRFNISMTLRNVSGAVRWNVQMARYFDGDINGDVADDTYLRTPNSILAADAASDDIISLRDIAPLYAHATAVHTFGAFNAASCAQASLATPTAPGDFVGRINYSFGNLAANASRTVRLEYSKLP
jgi:hypothetical protein